MIGLPANHQFDISDTIPFSAGPAIDIDSALKDAYSSREDLKAAESQVRASQLTRSAARAERLPSLAINGVTDKGRFADYTARESASTIIPPQRRP
jgi:outer membrane protein TolC